MSRWTRRRRLERKPLGPVTPVPGLSHEDKLLLRRIHRTEGAWR